MSSQITFNTLPKLYPWRHPILEGGRSAWWSLWDNKGKQVVHESRYRTGKPRPADWRGISGSDVVPTFIVQHQVQPFLFLVRGYPIANEYVSHLQNDPGGHGGITDRGDDTDRLHA